MNVCVSVLEYVYECLSVCMCGALMRKCGRFCYGSVRVSIAGASMLVCVCVCVCVVWLIVPLRPHFVLGVRV